MNRHAPNTRSSLRFFGLFAILLTTFSNPAFAAVTEPLSPRELWFYRALNKCKTASFDCLERRRLIRGMGENVYRLDGAEAERYDHEIKSARDLARYLGLRVLLVPHLPKFGNVPVIDAIVFGADGMPLANVGLKSYAGDSEKLTAKIWQRLYRAEKVYLNCYHREYIPSRCHVGVADDGQLVAAPTMLDREARLTMVTTIGRLFGLRKNERRPAWSVVDVRRAQDEPFYVAGDDLRIGDATSTVRISLDHLIESAHTREGFDRTIVMVNDRVLDVSAAGFAIHETCGRVIARDR